MVKFPANVSFGPPYLGRVVSTLLPQSPCAQMALDVPQPTPPAYTQRHILPGLQLLCWVSLQVAWNRPILISAGWDWARRVLGPFLLLPTTQVHTSDSQLTVYSRSTPQVAASGSYPRVPSLWSAPQVNSLVLVLWNTRYNQ